MNEQIKLLKEQAMEWVPNMADPDTKIRLLNYEKFAELIVRECVDRVTSKANGWGDMTGFAIKESILDCAKDLKQHFGVE
jgi:uncharacterized protein YlzI (FlbEa/FlbD family)